MYDFQLFGDEELIDFSKFDSPGTGGMNTTSETNSSSASAGHILGSIYADRGAPASGQELVSYNPSLFELTEDDSQFFDDSSNLFLDDELQSMLTTDRDKLSKYNSGTFFNTDEGSTSSGASGLATPVVAASPDLQQSSAAVVSGAARRKRK